MVRRVVVALDWSQAERAWWEVLSCGHRLKQTRPPTGEQIRVIRTCRRCKKKLPGEDSNLRRPH